MDIHSNKRNILVVDDNVDICSTLADIFIAEGYAVDAVSEASEAIELVKNKKIDILLTDIQMEPIDGLELVKKVTKIKPQVLLFMMTAYPHDNRIQEAYTNGVIKIFAKPFNVESFLREFNEEVAKREKKRNN